MQFRSAKTLCLTTLLIVTLVVSSFAAQPASRDNSRKNYNEWTITLLEAAMAAGDLTSEKLTKYYIQ
jgi:hypothetical protein